MVAQIRRHPRWAVFVTCVLLIAGAALLAYAGEIDFTITYSLEGSSGDIDLTKIYDKAGETPEKPLDIFPVGGKITLTADVGVTLSLAEGEEAPGKLENVYAWGVAELALSSLAGITGPLTLTLRSEMDGEATYLLENVAVSIKEGVVSVFDGPIRYRAESLYIDTRGGLWMAVPAESYDGSVSIESIEVTLDIDPENPNGEGPPNGGGPPGPEDYAGASITFFDENNQEVTEVPHGTEITVVLHASYGRLGGPTDTIWAMMDLDGVEYEDQGMGEVTITQNFTAQNTNPWPFHKNVEGGARNLSQAPHMTSRTIGTLIILPGGVDLTVYYGKNGPAVPDEEEEVTPAIVLLNWDNDNDNYEENGDAIPDLYDDEVEGEDDLAKLEMSINPLPARGTVTLTVNSAGREQIRFWRHSDKRQEQTQLTWNLENEDPPSVLWIEGVKKSEEMGEIEITLTYAGPEGASSDLVLMGVNRLNLGNAVYREMGLFRSRGHSALVVEYEGGCTPDDLTNPDKYFVIEMGIPMAQEPSSSSKGQPRRAPLTLMVACEGLEYWASFCNVEMRRNPEDRGTFVLRHKIIEGARRIYERRNSIGYCLAGIVRPRKLSKLTASGDAIANVKHLRCDGLVELVYEVNGIEAWGAARPLGFGTWPKSYHYGMLKDQTSLSEHNRFRLLYKWGRFLFPATQCGHESRYRFGYWNMRFGIQRIGEPVGPEPEPD